MITNNDLTVAMDSSLGLFFFKSLVLKSLSRPQVVPGSFTVSLSGVQAVSTLNFQR